MRTGPGASREHGRKVPFTAMSAAEPGTGPVTFRAMFTEQLRAQREQMGLLQREFADKAHVSLSSVKQYEAGKKKP
jgi:predicted transcriptional regulator